MCSITPLVLQSLVSRSRSAPFAATPPPMQSRFTPVFRTASIALLARQSTTAC